MDRLREGIDPMEIYVEPRSVYGQTLIYPVCEQAKRFAKLAGTKTLTSAQLRIIREMGVAIHAPALAAFERVA